MGRPFASWQAGSMGLSFGQARVGEGWSILEKDQQSHTLGMQTKHDQQTKVG
jgi:hypothetical protein